MKEERIKNITKPHPTISPKTSDKDNKKNTKITYLDDAAYQQGNTPTYNITAL